MARQAAEQRQGAAGIAAARGPLKSAELHSRIQSKLDELKADFKQLAVDERAADEASARARRDRMEGFKRALRDLHQAAESAEQEWH